MPGNVKDNIETNRLNFVVNRDGLSNAVLFAKQSIQMYRTSVLLSRKRGYTNPHHASLPHYRRGFIESYCAFKRFVAQNDGNHE